MPAALALSLANKRLLHPGWSYSSLAPSAYLGLVVPLLVHLTTRQLWALPDADLRRLFVAAMRLHVDDREEFDRQITLSTASRLALPLVLRCFHCLSALPDF